MSASGQGRVAPPEIAIESVSGTPQVAPTVVAVVVTRNPGAWFEDALEGLADQNYPDLRVLVVDAGSDEDPSSRIRRVLPDAIVRGLDANPGFGRAANEVIAACADIEASFYAICHDDVSLAPDAVRVMVEEAFRSNAGIIGPKIVMWDRPDRLLQVGMAADKTGVLSPLVERGELDQEQHDAVRDVFCVPGSCMLIRADLFGILGGFDPDIPLLGEDLDLCWRAQVLGGRVVVAPGAVARHIEALGERRDVDDRRRLQHRHRLRSMLTCYSFWHLVRVVPQAAVLALVETVYALLAGRLAHARDIAGAWTWNLWRWRRIRANRRRLQKNRLVADRDIRRLQVRGSARFSAFVRGQIGRGDTRIRSMQAASREFAGSLRGPARQVAAFSAVVISFVLLVGSRYLLTRDLSALGDLPDFPDRPWTLFGQWLSGWRDAGLGSESPAPTAFPLMGAVGTLTFGVMSAARKVLLVGLLPVGALGMWRFTRPAGTARSRLLSLITYLAIPLPYNAIAEGRWSGLVIWATVPWLATRLVRSMTAEPWGTGGDRRRRGLLRAWLALGFMLGLATSFAPAVLIAGAVVTIGLFVGSLLVGQFRGCVRLLPAFVGGVVVAAVLQGPWLPALWTKAAWDVFAGPSPAGVQWDLGAMLRFETGPIGAAPVGFAFVVVAALPLLIGRGWRLAWAGRGWVIAIAGWAALWASQQGWSPVGISTPEVLLVPAAFGLALAAGLGWAAFETDLPGYRFGWRQILSGVAAIAAIAGIMPVLGAATDGRWNRPAVGFDRLLAFVDGEEQEGSFRVLWVGQPAALPVGGWELDDGVAFGFSEGIPTVEDHWVAPIEGGTELVADALEIVEDGETSRLGRLLGPMAVRYVVVPESVSPFDSTRRPLRESLRAALAEQLDLEEVEVNDRLTVYRNAAWVPQRAQLPDDADVEVEGGADAYLAAAARVDLRGAEPLLRRDEGTAAFAGTVPDGSRVYQADTFSERWRLEVNGKELAPRRGFGWATAFDVSDGGRATLTYRTPALRYALIGGQALLWLWAVAWLRRVRRGERADDLERAIEARQREMHVDDEFAEVDR